MPIYIKRDIEVIEKVKKIATMLILKTFTVYGKIKTA